MIIPLMQGDAVHVHHWMTDDQFLDAGALAFLAGAGPVAIGAIAGAAVILALALDQAWQAPS